MDVLQKLLMPWQSRDAIELGQAAVGGAVVRAGEVLELQTPEALLAAYGLGEDRFGPSPDTVDVLRFPLTALMRLARPPRGEAPWPTYSTGFLRSAELTSVWFLERTRLPQGTELWRISADGTQRPVTVYEGAARGWRGARQWTAPVPLVGPRAVWQGTELAADLGMDGTVELIATGAAPPAGFTQARPMVWTRRVAAADCESVFERQLTCTWRGAACRVVQSTPQEARLVLTTDDAEAVRRLGADEVEPSVFEVTAPVGELADLGGHVLELPTHSGSGTA